jgi:hypothetical protein
MLIAAGGIVSFLKCIYFLASHVLGTHSFPQPLTPEEEAYPGHLQQLLKVRIPHIR